MEGGAALTAAGAAPVVRRLWCEHAWLGGAEPAAGVRVELDGERIATVTAGAAAAATTSASRG